MKNIHQRNSLRASREDRIEFVRAIHYCRAPMSNLDHTSRSVDLPPGCIDLMDVEGIRYWNTLARQSWPAWPADQLAYMEGFLARILQLAGDSSLVCISAHSDRGQVLVRPDPDPTGPALFAECSGAGQAQAVRVLFEEAGISPITGAVGRWRTKCLFVYPLPRDPVAAARFIGEVFRDGYGLSNNALISFRYASKKTVSLTAEGREY
jgi:hypothetical protein